MLIEKIIRLANLGYNLVANSGKIIALDGWLQSGTTVHPISESQDVSQTGRVRIGNTLAPTSNLQIDGSVAIGFVTVTTTTTISNTVSYIICNNGATAITITLPSPSTCAGRFICITRATGSTGTITVRGATGLIQALLGTMGATTSIGIHGATGQGVGKFFFSNGINWMR